MARDNKLEPAKLDWGSPGDGTLGPRSVLFDDIYFSGDGAAETRHVFIDGNGLPDRWRSKDRFTIGELGFGTGLNFLCAWEAWRASEKLPGAHLHFLSFEAFPLPADDMALSHQAWPSLAALSKKLRDILPPAQPGIHQRRLDDNVTLTLFYGEALSGLTQCEACVDAWFFDGFSPSKNPEMWTSEIFAEAAKITAPDGTLATFTVASAVRRALEGAGFNWIKRPGFGRKKEMLSGRLISAAKTSKPSSSKRRPWFENNPAPLSAGASIAIIGGGIAGASLAHTLLSSGFNPVIFEREEPAAGASGNPAGLIMPRLDLGDTAPARFFASAYLHTLALLGDINDPSIFKPCGVTLHGNNDREVERQQKIIDARILPDEFVKRSRHGLIFPQGGVVAPAALVKHLIGGAPVRIENVKRIARTSDNWRIETDKNVDTFNAVIIANALDVLRFEQARSLPLAGSAGQVDYFPQAAPPEQAHAFGPYAAPAPDGGMVIGATYAPVIISEKARFTREATQSNIDAVARVIPDLTATLDPNESRPRASVRCTTPDRLPIVGAAPDWGFYGGAYDGLRKGRRENYPIGAAHPNLFILTGLGSRGLVTAPLCAAMITAALTGAPSPVDIDVAQALHPARFFIRDLKKSTNPS